MDILGNDAAHLASQQSASHRGGGTPTIDLSSPPRGGRAQGPVRRLSQPSGAPTSSQRGPYEDVPTPPQQSSPAGMPASLDDAGGGEAAGAGDDRIATLVDMGFDAGQAAKVCFVACKCSLQWPVLLLPGPICAVATSIISSHDR